MGGLRGGMTLMMALMVDPYWSPNQNLLLNATIVVVIGHCYLCGCTGPLFLRLLKIPVGVPQEDGNITRGDSVLRGISNRIVSHANEIVLTGLRPRSNADSEEPGEAGA